MGAKSSYLSSSILILALLAINALQIQPVRCNALDQAAVAAAAAEVFQLDPQQPENLELVNQGLSEQLGQDERIGIALRQFMEPNAFDIFKSSHHQSTDLASFNAADSLTSNLGAAGGGGSSGTANEVTTVAIENWLDSTINPPTLQQQQQLQQQEQQQQQSQQKNSNQQQQLAAATVSSQALRKLISQKMIRNSQPVHMRLPPRFGKRHQRRATSGGGGALGNWISFSPKQRCI